MVKIKSFVKNPRDCLGNRLVNHIMILIYLYWRPITYYMLLCYSMTLIITWLEYGIFFSHHFRALSTSPAGKKYSPVEREDLQYWPTVLWTNLPCENVSNKYTIIFLSWWQKLSRTCHFLVVHNMSTSITKIVTLKNFSLWFHRFKECF